MPHRLTRLLSAGALSMAMVTLLAGITVASSGTTYRITITNETSGQPFTPPVLITHDPTVSVFEIGAAASEGVIQIAENGNVMPLVDALTGADGVHDVVTGPDLLSRASHRPSRSPPMTARCCPGCRC